MAAALIEILANAAIRGGLVAADLATSPPYFDFIGDGTGTGKPNTCIMKIGADQDADNPCSLSVTCGDNTATYDVTNCVVSGSNSFSDPNIGDFRLDFGDSSVNEAPFPAQPMLYLQYLYDDDPDLDKNSLFSLGQCNLSKGDQQGQFSGTACDSDDKIDLKLCEAEQTDEFSTYTYWIAVSTLGHSYACDTDSKAKKSLEYMRVFGTR